MFPEFESADELYQYAQTFVNTCGFALVKKQTHKNHHDELKNMELQIRNENHNHDYSENMLEHSIACQLTEQQLESVAAMTVARSCPREIVSTIRQNDPAIPIISRDIYNIREQLLLIDELREEDYIYEYEYNNTGCVTHLFFAHKESINFTCQYSSVLLMDCKDEEDYKWALTCIVRLFEGISKPGIIVTDRELSLMNALKIVFPNSTNLLCLWHISKNVLKNCKPQFPKENKNSSSKDAYANLKAYLQTSAGDLHRVHTKISLMVTNQKEEINSITINREYQKASCVTVQNLLPPCTGSFSRTMGLPCVHRIQHLKSSQGLTLKDIHIHWWIQGCLPIPQFEEHQAATREMLNDMINSSSIVLQNPNIVHTKGHPLDATNNQPSTSTRRDPSGFESVEQNVKQCSFCRQPGHNAYTCPNRSNTN
ncbi:5737_t:CDS:2 [Cetraspora pellucida]|uniref:5737_t:CDS:1 n=1 Tax=Cetraspora pellucida TaxID=1433469 RepID=A0A9N9D8Q7_9GLOM|nr:5737_t:CDS:2 [Cetraspora pellucida]